MFRLLRSEKVMPLQTAHTWKLQAWALGSGHAQWSQEAMGMCAEHKALRLL